MLLWYYSVTVAPCNELKHYTMTTNHNKIKLERLHYKLTTKYNKKNLERWHNTVTIKHSKMNKCLLRKITKIIDDSILQERPFTNQKECPPCGDF